VVPSWWLTSGPITVANDTPSELFKKLLMASATGRWSERLKVTDQRGRTWLELVKTRESTLWGGWRPHYSPADPDVLRMRRMDFLAVSTPIKFPRKRPGGRTPRLRELPDGRAKLEFPDGSWLPLGRGIVRGIGPVDQRIRKWAEIFGARVALSYLNHIGLAVPSTLRIVWHPAISCGRPLGTTTGGPASSRPEVALTTPTMSSWKSKTRVKLAARSKKLPYNHPELVGLRRGIKSDRLGLIALSAPDRRNRVAVRSRRW
jgi:hypothetical protein